MRPDSLEKVLKRIGTAEGIALVIKRQVEGKFRATSTLW
jgi:hypothetical protein